MFELGVITPIRNKRSVVRTLLQGADSLASEKEDKTKEVGHIQKGLKRKHKQTLGFQHHATKDKSREHQNQRNQQETILLHAINLPYISKQLARIFKSYDIPQTDRHCEVPVGAPESQNRQRDRGWGGV